MTLLWIVVGVIAAFHIHAIVASNDTCIANSTRTINATVSSSQNVTFLCCLDTLVEEYSGEDTVFWRHNSTYVETCDEKTRPIFCQKYVDTFELDHEAKLYVDVSKLTSVTSYALSCELSHNDIYRKLIEVNIRVLPPTPTPTPTPTSAHQPTTPTSFVVTTSIMTSIVTSSVPMTSESGKKVRVDVIVPTVVLLLLVVNFVAIGCVIWWRRRRRRENDSFAFQSGDLSFTSLRLGEKLGTGYFGNVFEAHVTSVGVEKQIAVKMLHDDTNTLALKTFFKEANIVTSLDKHPNIIRIYGLHWHDGSLCILMDYAEHGDLRTYLRSKGRPDSKEKTNRSDFLYDLISNETKLRYAIQVANGMEYLASKKFVHGDLAARNILVCKGEQLRVCDFGLAKDLGGNDYYRKSSGAKSDVLPFRWCSPELLSYKIYSEYSDVWSFGILLWEISTCGGTPYPGLDVNKLFDCLMTQKYRMSRPRGCSQRMYEVMSDCWNDVPIKRPTFSAILSRLNRNNLDRYSNGKTALESPV